MFQLKSPRRRVFVLSCLAILATVALVVASGEAALLSFLPALLLPSLLAMRCYPGERTLLVLARSDRRPRPRRARSCAIASRRPRASIPRGSLLLACSLAVRPPPALSLTTA